MNRIIALVIVTITLLITCQKNDDPPPPPPIGEDSLITVKSNFTEVDTLQDIYKATNRADYYLYGKRRSDGKLTQVSSMAIKKQNTSDSILNILYDDSFRVSGFYFIVKGIKDTSLITLSYTSDTLNYCQYKVDWTTGERLTRYKVALKNSGTNNYTPLNVTAYRIQGNQSIFDDATAFLAAYYANVYAAGALGAVFSYVAVAIGVAATAPASAIIGFAAGVVVYEILSSNANAFEISNTPLGSPNNPSSLFNKLKTIKDLITIHPWKYETRIRDGNNDLRPCDADDIWTFMNNNTVTTDRGAIKCDPLQTQSVLNNWQLYDNDQALRIFNSNGEFYNLTISKITLSNLELIGVDDLGISWKFIFKSF